MPTPTDPGTRLTAAGVTWDAIRVTRFYGLRALAFLDDPGSVAVDPSPADAALIFFVPPGSTAEWNVPQSAAFGSATHLEIPAGDKDRPPGPYWLIKPRSGWRIHHIPVQRLRAALRAGLAGSGAPGRGAADG